MFLFTKQDNTETTVYKLLKQLSITVNQATISAELERHPDYPGLLAISDVLTNLNVKNSAYRIKPDELNNVPCPFIAHTTINGGDFVVVTQMDKERVVVSSNKWNNHKLTMQEFKELFKDIVLTAEPSTIITSPSTTTKLTTFLTNIKTPALAAGILFILAAALIFHTNYFNTLSWQMIWLTIAKSLGMATAILLLIQSIDTNNPMVQVLCQSVGKSNCNAILSSKAAKVFEGLTWSEVGFYYFTGTWLLLLFGGSSVFNLQVLAVLNFISLPYTVYSIYYQAGVAKQWCLLCCTIQTLLWLEFVPLIVTFTKPSLLVQWTPMEGRVWEVLTTSCICLLLPVIIWQLLKPLLLKQQQVKPLKQQLRKFKYNTKLFNKLLTEQPKYTQPEDGWSIVLGNTEANTIITMVSNPYCPPCSKTHQELDTWLNKLDDFQLRIIFNANNNDNDIKTPVTRHLMALNDQQDKSIVKRALHDWYGQKQKSYESWAEFYPVTLDEKKYEILERQKEWCNMAEIRATPTLLVNGYRLPEAYRLHDIKYMLG